MMIDNELVWLNANELQQKFAEHGDAIANRMSNEQFFRALETMNLPANCYQAVSASHLTEESFIGTIQSAIQLERFIDQALPLSRLLSLALMRRQLTPDTIDSSIESFQKLSPLDISIALDEVVQVAKEGLVQLQQLDPALPEPELFHPRKSHVVAVYNRIQQDTMRDLELLQQHPRVDDRMRMSIFPPTADGLIWTAQDVFQELLHDSILQWYKTHISDLSHDWFEQDHQYKKTLADTVDFRKLAVGKVWYWIENPHLQIEDIVPLTLEEAESARIAGLWQQLRDLLAEKTEQNEALIMDEIRPIATTLCLYNDLLQEAPPDEFAAVDKAEYDTDEEDVALDGAQAGTTTTDYNAEGKEQEEQQQQDQGEEEEEEEEYGEETPLMKHAKLGMTDNVRLLALAGVKTTAKDFTGKTALIHATEAGQRDVVECLVKDFGVNMEAADSLGQTALAYAVKKGRKDLIELLHGLGGDIETKDYNGKTLLMHAVKTGNVDVMRYLVKDLSIDIDATDNEGRTALMEVIAPGNISMVEMMVREFGANVSVRAKDGSTALHAACAEGLVGIADLLAKQTNCDVNAADNEGKTPLIYAVGIGDEDLVRLLVKGFYASIDVQDNQGMTATMWGAKYGHAELVEVLATEMNADIEMQDNRGATPLMLAASEGHEDLVAFLIINFAVDVNATELTGKSPIIFAAGGGYRDMVKMLATQFNADAMVCDNEGKTALHWAAKYGHASTVALLVEDLHMDIDAKDHAGKTALMNAAEENSVKVVRRLGELKADVNAKAKNGRTALMYAANNGHYQVVECLVCQLKAELFARDAGGKSAQDYADSAGLPNLKEMIRQAERKKKKAAKESQRDYESELGEM